jgi:uncharacterized protein (TIGR00156 family)
MEKRYFVWLSVFLILVGLTVNAQQGGYKGPGSVAITVAEAKNLRDDSPVVLQGKIERFLGNEKYIFPAYLFSDNSGNISVIIPDRIWNGLSVDQNDVVEITGIIDRDFTETEVIVRSIKKI